MKKQIIPIILGILLMGIISAGVTITPLSIQINAFPGETHQVNITIKADGNYLLIFNSTDSKITITPESMATINGEINTKINLTFAKDISLGAHTFDVKGSTEVITIEVPVYRGGGTRKVYVENKTIVEVDNYIDREIEVMNNTEIDNLYDKIRKFEEDINKQKRNIWLTICFLIISILFLLVLLNNFIKTRRKLKGGKNGKIKNS